MASYIKNLHERMELCTHRPFTLPPSSGHLREGVTMNQVLISFFKILVQNRTLLPRITVHAPLSENSDFSNFFSAEFGPRLIGACTYYPGNVACTTIRG